MGSEYNLERKAIVKYMKDSSLTTIQNLSIRSHFESTLTTVDEVPKVSKLIKVN